MPLDLKKALEEKSVLEKFESFAPSYKRTFLRWLERAKLAETRKKRIGDIVTRAIENRSKWNS
jgi:uncharacterized protein YdeI (YjbR/CyaY-like superfamily)